MNVFVVCPIEIFLSMWIDRMKRRRGHFWGYSLNTRDMGCARFRLFVLHVRRTSAVMSAEKERDTVYVSDIITFLRENYRLVITYA